MKKNHTVFIYRLKQVSNPGVLSVEKQISERVGVYTQDGERNRTYFYGGLTNAGRSCYIRNAKIGVWTELNGKIRIVVDKFPFTAFWRRCDVCDNLNI